MASKEVTERDFEAEFKAKVELWASTLDALLQEMVAKTKANDTLGAAVAAARLAQYGTMCDQYFRAIAEGLAASETDLKALNQGMRLIRDSFQQRLNALNGKDEPVSSGPAKSSLLN
jgi:hypothetical protein